jgi:hypothetical protein
LGKDKVYIGLESGLIMTLGPEFWARNSKQVARDLVMKPIFDYTGFMDILSRGILTEVDAFDGPIREKDSHLFSQEPGTLGVFASRRGAIPVITAHANGRTGLVTLRAVVSGEDKYGPTQISDMLGLDQCSGKLVGNESGLYIGESGIDYQKEGIRVVNEIPNGSPENRVAYWKAVRG